MAMTHLIETNVPLIEANNVIVIIKRRCPEADFTVTTLEGHPTGDSLVKVKVIGNGAILRDVAFALDVAGYLD